MGWRVIALITLIGCGRGGFDPRELGQLTMHGTHGCALTDDGVLYCWGSNEFGQIGEGSAPLQLFPRRVPNVPLFDRVDIGEQNTYGIAAGQVWAWGGNSNGLLGIGLTTTIPEPMARAIAATDVEQLAVGQLHVCARHRDGGVSCWGRNSCGSLGDGTIVDHYEPQRVPAISGVASVAVSDTQTCVIDQSGTLTCWGGTCPSPNPTPVTLPRIVQIEGGCHVTMCALEEVGRVWCAGENAYGQLGDGTTAYRIEFTKPVDFGANPPRIIEIAVGSYHTCGRSADHRVWCWGDNAMGSLGTGDVAAMQPLPQQLPFFDGTIAIDELESGCGHTCARSGDYLYCWGENRFAQFGDGTMEARFAPIRVRLDLR